MMMPAAFLFLLSTILLSGKAAASCHPSDKEALLAIRDALGNPDQLSSWTTESSCCDDWINVECDDSTGRVTALCITPVGDDDDEVDGSSTPGTIPEAIASLSHLEELQLIHLPNLSGPIPPAIAKLSNLSVLIISSTAISGPVPPFLGELRELTQLDLSNNSLSGSIPASLADNTNLCSIDISHNSLTGSLPPSLFSKAKPPQDDDEEGGNYTVSLDLSHNRLSGSIPAEWSAVMFDTLSLSSNAFTGDASDLFGREKPLDSLDLSYNRFSFNLSGVELPEELDFLDLSHNAIYGSIPVQVPDFMDSQDFNVSYNLLCGEVPDALASFDADSFQHNSCLCGAPLEPCR